LATDAMQLVLAFFLACLAPVIALNIIQLIATDNKKKRILLRLSLLFGFSLALCPAEDYIPCYLLPALTRLPEIFLGAALAYIAELLWVASYRVQRLHQDTHDHPMLVPRVLLAINTIATVIDTAAVAVTDMTAFSLIRRPCQFVLGAFLLYFNFKAFHRIKNTFKKVTSRLQDLRGELDYHTARNMQTQFLPVIEAYTNRIYHLMIGSALLGLVVVITSFCSVVIIAKTIVSDPTETGWCRHYRSFTQARGYFRFFYIVFQIYMVCYGWIPLDKSIPQCLEKLQEFCYRACCSICCCCGGNSSESEQNTTLAEIGPKLTCKISRATMAHTVTYNTKWVSSDGKPFKSIPIISMQNLRSQTSMMDEKKSTSPYLAQPRSPMNPKRVGSSPRERSLRSPSRSFSRTPSRSPSRQSTRSIRHKQQSPQSPTFSGPNDLNATSSSSARNNTSSLMIPREKSSLDCTVGSSAKLRSPLSSSMECATNTGFSLRNPLGLPALLHVPATNLWRSTTFLTSNFHVRTCACVFSAKTGSKQSGQHLTRSSLRSSLRTLHAHRIAGQSTMDTKHSCQDVEISTSKPRIQIMINNF